LGLGAGHAAADCAAVAAHSASATALCDDRTCCSELLRSVIRAVGTIERFEWDPDDSAALWVVPASTKAWEYLGGALKEITYLNCLEILFASKNGSNYLLLCCPWFRAFVTAEPQR
jgi:hypothetical protein